MSTAPERAFSDQFSGDFAVTGILDDSRAA
jgi:hypothetical protein